MSDNALERKDGAWRLNPERPIAVNLSPKTVERIHAARALYFGTSARHVWRFLTTAGISMWCDRCDRSFVPDADARGPAECVPTAAWRAAHPDDDGETR